MLLTAAVATAALAEEARHHAGAVISLDPGGGSAMQIALQTDTGQNVSLYLPCAAGTAPELFLSFPIHSDRPLAANGISSARDIRTLTGESRLLAAFLDQSVTVETAAAWAVRDTADDNFFTAVGKSVGLNDYAEAVETLVRILTQPYWTIVSFGFSTSTRSGRLIGAALVADLSFQFDPDQYRQMATMRRLCLT